MNNLKDNTAVLNYLILPWKRHKRKAIMINDRKSLFDQFCFDGFFGNACEVNGIGLIGGFLGKGKYGKKKYSKQ